MPLLSIAQIARQVTTRPTLVQGLLITGLVWAAIYLPGLGSVELKHEEPRRALPAVHMIASGDWLVPRVGEVPYLRKPPLLNWLIAGMFKLTEGRSEWAVRFPSVLATLVLALGIVINSRQWIGSLGGLLASIFFLTNLAVLESGRLAELEAVYISVTGLALVIWLAKWYRGITGLRLWLWPAVLLALGLLTKGPTHLIFFYGVIIPVLIWGKDMKLLGRPAHGFAVLLMLVIFSLWAIPCSFAVGQQGPLGVWQFWIHQITSRASEGEAFRVQTWLLNFPQTLKNFLPWTPLLILLWTSGIESRADGVTEGIASDRLRAQAIFYGARLGMVITCLLMCLLPSGSPRYIYPLFVVPCLLLGQVFVQAKINRLMHGYLKSWHWINAVLLVAGALAVLAIPFIGGINAGSLLGLAIGIGTMVLAWVTQRLPEGELKPIERAARRTLITGLVFAAGMITYGTAIVPRVDAMSTNGFREVAARIRKELPAGAILWVQENEYKPFWYYLEPDVRYFLSISDIPADARYFLLPEAAAPAFAADPRLTERHLHAVAQVVDGEKERFSVMERDGEAGGQ
ncbi:MAG: glycosyltransferase family 39 protein [Verrucomicrobia bacterium]|nr:glycosyltransferase family 39 protein [Verrucomicrobiota bacterium]